MILLKSNYYSLQKLKGNERWAYLFAIADIYATYSASEYPDEAGDLYTPHPLLDTEVVKILKSKYNLSTRRQNIESYRKKLTTFFHYYFKRNKKGWYISHTADGRINDDNLLLLAIIFYNNSSLSEDDTKDVLERLSELAISKNVKNIIQNLLSIQTLDKSEEIGMSCLSSTISVLMEAIETHREICFKHINRVSKSIPKNEYTYYPLFLFCKNNLLYLLCSGIKKKDEKIHLHGQWIIRVDSITDVRAIGESYQIKGRKKYRRRAGDETHTEIDIAEYINGIGDIIEGRQRVLNSHIKRAEFKMIVPPSFQQPFINSLKNKYKSNVRFDFKKRIRTIQNISELKSIRQQRSNSMHR